MTAYCDKDDVVLVYGLINTERWARVDNDEDDTTMEARITWACGLATEYINSRLVNGRYVIPFTSVPTMVVNLAAMYAGILLFDARQVVSSDENRDSVSRQRKDFDRFIRQIQKGQLKLLDPSTSEPLTVQDRQVPATVSERTGDEDEEEWEQLIL